MTFWPDPMNVALASSVNIPFSAYTTRVGAVTFSPLLQARSCQRVVTGDVLLVVLAVSIWKVTVAGLRCLAVFGFRGLLVALPAVASLGTHAALAFGMPQGSLPGAGAMLIFALLAIVGSRVMRRIPWSHVN